MEGAAMNKELIDSIGVWVIVILFVIWWLFA
jgi:hypothetical protein